MPNHDARYVFDFTRQFKALTPGAIVSYKIVNIYKYMDDVSHLAQLVANVQRFFSTDGRSQPCSRTALLSLRGMLARRRRSRCLSGLVTDVHPMFLFFVFAALQHDDFVVTCGLAIFWSPHSLHPAQLAADVHNWFSTRCVFASIKRDLVLTQRRSQPCTSMDGLKHIGDI